ncbi:uncharacterized protein LOC124358671 [Homalodisca vitripennis]|uniref:uncharacterized protein LOC124358671 n=1 Tax=Homalodisca vitripennis TaxID=197043 RepID=UPI001EEBAD58|nr:uncharacterized protein LOC124358671 [Homalodisca vitripennis]
MRIQMRNQACSSKVKPVDVLSTSLLQSSDDAKAYCGRLSSVKRDIRRQRQRLFPAIPKVVADLHIPEEWKTTGGTSPRRFLAHDSGPGSSQRLLIFSTDNGLQNLTNSHTWFMDGTFKMSSNLFKQVYVIRGEQNNIISTCVYALMTEKTTEMYKKLLQVVLIKCLELGNTARPKVVMTHFELAAMSAVSEVFSSSVSVKGCYFHLCQSTWRQIQRLGLTKSYKEDSQIRLFCGMINGLAFLPMKDVLLGMEFLWGAAPFQLLELLHYFDTTYVSGTVGQTPSSPLFSPRVWNVHEATLGNYHRTNNACESWNNRFNSLINQNNPSIWTVLEAIRKDEAMERTRSLSLTQDVPTTKTSLQKHQRRLQGLCQDYVSGKRDLPSFLRAVGSTIRYY